MLIDFDGLGEILAWGAQWIVVAACARRGLVFPIYASELFRRGVEWNLLCVLALLLPQSTFGFERFVFDAAGRGCLDARLCRA